MAQPVIIDYNHGDDFANLKRLEEEIALKK